ncbi:MAG: zinc ribbon domain-containing protein [Chloroflexota bacterium]
MRTCANCGTEVDEDAAFCPSCGQPLAAEPSTPGAPPPAPSWHAGEDEPELARGASTAAWSRSDASDEATDAGDVPLAPGAASLVPPITPSGEPFAQDPLASPPPAPPVTPAPRPATASQDATRREPTSINLPFTWPVTLSGWLVGGGAFIGGLALFVDFRLFSNPITIVLLVLLLAVAATVFLARSIPTIAYLQLMVMATVFIGLGVALDRIGFGSVVGIGSAILLLAMIAAATGVVIAETGRDRPWAGPGPG